MIRSDYLKQLLYGFEIELTERQIEQFDRYAQLLVEWNQKINLTSIIEPDDIAIKHFLDSLLFFKAIEPEKGAKLIDVGTGAGFPSTPLAIMREDLQVTQLDSLQKRLLFLQEVADQLDLRIQTLHLRAEEGGRQPEYREQYDFATARAVAALPVLCEYCIPYVKPGGYFVALKGYEVEQELEGAQRGIALLGAQIDKVCKFTLPNQDKRSIVVIKKISQTPAKYPRMQGKIKKSPL